MVDILVTKVSVSKVMEKMFAITLNMQVMDGETELINQNFTEYHKIGNSVDYTVNKFTIKMQAAIDEYKAEQAIYTAAALDTAITTLEGGLIW